LNEAKQNRVEWNGMKRNGINFSFYCLDILKRRGTNFAIHHVPSKLKGNKIGDKWWYEMKFTPSNSIPLFFKSKQ
jgi:hypothetical protein